MAAPKLSDFVTWIGQKFTRTDWDANINAILNILTDGTYDLNVNKVTSSTYVGINPSDFAISSPQGYKYGLSLSNGSDASHDIDISVGTARDSTNDKDLILSSSITKQIDANWAEGTAAGGFPSGLTIANNTWYHFFVILKSDGATVDAGFDTSLTATNLLADATSYTEYRRIGSVLTDGSANILPFTQTANDFWWDTKVTDLSTSSGATTANLTLTTPLGIKTKAMVNGTATGSAGGYGDLQIRDLSLTGSFYLCGHIEDSAASLEVGNANIWTNTSSQIEYTHSSSGTYTSTLYTNGWVDPFIA